VAIVVVTWNGAGTSRRCLHSLREIDYNDYRVCLVDNGSAPGFAGPIAAEFPEVQVASLPENMGYAGGCNAGIEWARRERAEYVLLLNDDTTVAPDILRALVARSATLPGPAIVAPKILTGRLPDTIWSAGGFVRRPWFKADHVGEGQSVDAHQEARDVEWASGCALFFPMSLVDAIGPMDDRYFLYLEDVDWCLRARSQGLRVLYEPAARVWHEVSAATSQLDTRVKRYYSYRNYYLLAITHSGFLGRVWIALHFGVTLAKISARSTLFAGYRNNPWYHARTRAMFDFLQRRWGKAPYGDEPRTSSAAATPGEVPA
jgi:hypothetical protein